MNCSIFKDDRVVASRVVLANTFLSRLVGLLSKRKQDDNCGLLLMPCNQVHTHFMRFPIDVVFLSDTNVVLHVESMLPGKVSLHVPECQKVLELNFGVTGAFDIKPGVQLRVIQNDEVADKVVVVQREENRNAEV